MTVEWERGGLLGGRGLCCWAGKRCAAGRESARLLGGREVGCWVEETRRESAVLLGRREVDDGCAAGWEVRRERDG